MVELFYLHTCLKVEVVLDLRFDVDILLINLLLLQVPKGFNLKNGNLMQLILNLQYALSIHLNV